MLATLANWRSVIAQGRALPTNPSDPVPRWDLHLERIAAIEEIVRAARPEDLARFDELNAEFMLDFQADMAAKTAAVMERMVGRFDDIAQRAEDRKFELSSADREGIEEMLDPYKEGIREEMLGQLPIETRRRLEEEQRRRAAGGEPPAAEG